MSAREIIEALMNFTQLDELNFKFYVHYIQTIKETTNIDGLEDKLTKSWQYYLTCAKNQKINVPKSLNVLLETPVELKLSPQAIEVAESYESVERYKHYNKTIFPENDLSHSINLINLMFVDKFLSPIEDSTIGYSNIVPYLAHAMFHDFGEIIVDDAPTRTKDENFEKKEQEAYVQLVKKFLGDNKIYNPENTRHSHKLFKHYEWVDAMNKAYYEILNGNEAYLMSIIWDSKLLMPDYKPISGFMRPILKQYRILLGQRSKGELLDLNKVAFNIPECRENVEAYLKKPEVISLLSSTNN